MKSMEKQENELNNLLISYKTLRKAVGILGITLPITLFAGSKLIGQCDYVQHSISHYYYTLMGDVFVGTLCAFGIFLITYKGYTKTDNIASNLAGLFAICVALFPTYENTDLQCCIFNLAPNNFRTGIHYSSAALFFIVLAFISYFLFTKSSGDITPQKIIRNRIYRICAFVIVLSIISIFLFHKVPAITKTFSSYQPVFFLESLALFAFGFSWLIKGETIFKDKNEVEQGYKSESNSVY